ncbi:D-alanyl-lipoteichoic acid biosynthesis protein DltB [Slackia heliotrinireducens]|uniref:Predicted membrane protein involved in D-alanine export n=1 Tax=Slackia heliotrinireducens (strain ATCC 29202 / DSM 20476 / NCTC 11029 / RHS 1) TaxID=471855 RepID=C7N6E6_SLAHD|nr:MBOAT family O-acyltransferase [Slackia heliotrinireducens]ACV22481.1 predicted membrane protein involved in D-alanine export [Slackia heliotrinireducens DSM 20476]VEH00878.1 D-alanyl-lipoteichoic acid biosynthesis protein DltB [Slackia heliotrinireducens]
MVFSSSAFLLFYCPIMLLVYFACRTRVLRNVWLLVASLLFYSWGEPVYVLLMVLSIFMNWALSLAIGGSSKVGVRKALLFIAVVANVLVIGFFKYQGFVADNINALAGAEVIGNMNLPLPIGISFYTLQALSYVIDVYRKQVEPQRNILFLGMYVACFPQLIAGPIVRYSTIHEQVLGRKENLEDFASGLRLFVVGLSKKVLLANTCAILADSMLSQGGSAIGFVGAWGGLIAYTFQIFFDFSGYSDMAIGLGRMMGFKYLRNFNYPYISTSVTEFWRRWHISLSTFFRDYIYIPLGGSRCTTSRHIFNIAVVWTVTGLWHGAAWNYVLWGVYYGVLLICEKYLWGMRLAKTPRLVQHVYCIVIYVFGWSFFWITDSTQLVPYWQALVGMYGLTGSASFWELGVWEYWVVFAICVAASTPICPYVKERFLAWVEGRQLVDFLKISVVNPERYEADSLCVLEAEPVGKSQARLLAWANVAVDVLLVMLFLTSLASVISGSFNPFIYFQF